MPTVIERVVDALTRQPAGVPVGDLARQLGLTYQGVRNEIERSGLRYGVAIDRSQSPAVVRLVRRTPAAPVPTKPPTATDATLEADWEGNVQARLCASLVDNGWQLRQVANTITRERGTDVVATRGQERVHVEVKGWPSRSYADPARRQETKPTDPANQALHWFSGALLSALRLRESFPDDRVAMAFPERERYRRLTAQIATSLALTHVEVWFVTADGEVEPSRPDARRLHR